MEMSPLAGNAYFRRETLAQEGYSKGWILGEGTRDKPVSLQKAVATKPKRKSSPINRGQQIPNKCSSTRQSRKISNPDKGDWDERVLLKNADPQLTPCTIQKQ